MDPRASHSNLHEQEPVNITKADIQQWMSDMTGYTAPGPGMIQSY